MEPKFNASTKERNREVILVSALDDKDNPPVQGRRAKAKDDRWQLIKMHTKPLLLPDSLPRDINTILLGGQELGRVLS
ncbi:hypothetical protein M404DRAFT_25453 [Pisolithus tinctorius Marx 270]|uniref:Uncharacterized protein n=1 Tax=Pisolithus tinctorius Marx 270 TaxID=870435 RepID=A0A0C3K6T7_PISTI|nr:hypothetical protein M404DRAFT_25453 [Pisolithus tinctorius Marx 270]